MTDETINLHSAFLFLDVRDDFRRSRRESLTETRIEKACELLETTAMSVAEADAARRERRTLCRIQLSGGDCAGGADCGIIHTS